LGDFLGDFSLSLGDFLTKTSGHPGHNVLMEVDDTCALIFGDP
jgi:hypothetical protein